MDTLRESVGLRGYGQKDPLIEYKNEGYDMFLEMMTNMRRNVIYSMFMFQPQAPQAKAPFVPLILDIDSSKVGRLLADGDWDAVYPIVEVGLIIL